MVIALWLICSLLLASLILAAVLIREYLRVTRVRREFIALIGGSGKAVPKLKNILMVVYVVSTICWTIGLLLFFLWVT